MNCNKYFTSPLPEASSKQSDEVVNNQGEPNLAAQHLDDILSSYLNNLGSPEQVLALPAEGPSANENFEDHFLPNANNSFPQLPRNDNDDYSLSFLVSMACNSKVRCTQNPSTQSRQELPAHPQLTSCSGHGWQNDPWSNKDRSNLQMYQALTNWARANSFNGGGMRNDGGISKVGSSAVQHQASMNWGEISYKGNRTKINGGGSSSNLGKSLEQHQPISQWRGNKYNGRSSVMRSDVQWNVKQEKSSIWDAHYCNLFGMRNVAGTYNGGNVVQPETSIQWGENSYNGGYSKKDGQTSNIDLRTILEQHRASALSGASTSIYKGKEAANIMGSWSDSIIHVERKATTDSRQMQPYKGLTSIGGFNNISGTSTVGNNLQTYKTEFQWGSHSAYNGKRQKYNIGDSIDNPINLEMYSRIDQQQMLMHPQLTSYSGSVVSSSGGLSNVRSNAEIFQAPICLEANRYQAFPLPVDKYNSPVEGKSVHKAGLQQENATSSEDWKLLQLFRKAVTTKPETSEKGNEKVEMEELMVQNKSRSTTVLTGLPKRPRGRPRCSVPKTIPDKKIQKGIERASKSKGARKGTSSGGVQDGNSSTPTKVDNFLSLDKSKVIIDLEGINVESQRKDDNVNNGFNNTEQKPISSTFNGNDGSNMAIPSSLGQNIHFQQTNNGLNQQESISPLLDDPNFQTWLALSPQSKMLINPPDKNTQLCGGNQQNPSTSIFNDPIFQNHLFFLEPVDSPRYIPENINKVADNSSNQTYPSNETRQTAAAEGNTLGGNSSAQDATQGDHVGETEKSERNEAAEGADNLTRLDEDNGGEKEESKQKEELECVNNLKSLNKDDLKRMNWPEDALMGVDRYGFNVDEDRNCPASNV